MNRHEATCHELARIMNGRLIKDRWEPSDFAQAATVLMAEQDAADLGGEIKRIARQATGSTTHQQWWAAAPSCPEEMWDAATPPENTS